jgi:HAMP domain-containing protein
MESTRTDALYAQELLDVLTRLKNGDFTRLMSEGQGGTEGEIAETVNTLVRRLNPFAFEITRVSREIGTQGIFGGQAQVEGLPGTWQDLVTNINTMAGNLTHQFRDIAGVITARANGDLVTKVTVDARGETQELKDTLNVMGDQLNTLGAEVTRVVREIGTEGIFGGQAEVKGVAGRWKELVDNLNEMSANLAHGEIKDEPHLRGLSPG